MVQSETKTKQFQQNLQEPSANIVLRTLMKTGLDGDSFIKNAGPFNNILISNCNLENI